MSPAVNYSYFYRELEGLQEVGYTGSVKYGSAFGSKEAPFLLEYRMIMGY